MAFVRFGVRPLLVVLLAAGGLSAQAQKHLTRTWQSGRGYVLIECPYAQSGKRCPSRSWTVEFFRADGSIWGSVWSTSLARVTQDRDRLASLERQFEKRYPASSLFTASNYRHPSPPFCQGAVPLPARYAEEVTDAERILRSQERSAVEQVKVRVMQGWERWLRTADVRGTGHKPDAIALARDGAAIASSTLRICELDATLTDDATPHLSEIRRQVEGMEGALDYWIKSERRLAEAGHAAPSQIADNGHHDPAHPSAQDKLAAEDQDDLGLAYYRQDNFKAAAAAFLKACRLDGSNGAVQTHLGLLYEKQQKYAEEETAFRALVKRVPTLPHQHYWLGKALYLQRKYAEADIELRKAIVLASSVPWIYHYMLAKSLEAEGKHVEAAAEQKIADQIRKSQPQESP